MFRRCARACARTGPTGIGTTRDGGDVESALVRCMSIPDLLILQVLPVLRTGTSTRTSTGTDSAGNGVLSV
jgi:hypothetical protein